MNEPHARILMVEDEPQVLEINSRMLRRRGYEVLTAQTAMEAYEQLDAGLPDLLILDILLPDGNGLDICRQFRKKCLRPVLFLTGKSDVKDKVAGLMEGGDYYLTKPCQFDEFLAVIQMLLAREQRLMENLQSSRQITIKSLMLDLSIGHAYRNGCDVGLTRTEFSLLRLLALWGTSADGDTGTIRRHIFNLRTKIGADETDEYDIVSVYGKGYLLTCR